MSWLTTGQSSSGDLHKGSRTAPQARSVASRGGFRVCLQIKRAADCRFFRLYDRTLPRFSRSGVGLRFLSGADGVSSRSAPPFQEAPLPHSIPRITVLRGVLL